MSHQTESVSPPAMTAAAAAAAAAAGLTFGQLLEVESADALEAGEDVERLVVAGTCAHVHLNLDVSRGYQTVCRPCADPWRGYKAQSHVYI